MPVRSFVTVKVAAATFTDTTTACAASGASSRLALRSRIAWLAASPPWCVTWYRSTTPIWFAGPAYRKAARGDTPGLELIVLFHVGDRAVIVETADFDRPGQVGHAAVMIRVVMRRDQMIDPLDACPLHRGVNSPGVPPIDVRPTGVEQHRVTRGRHDQRGRSAFDVDEVEVERPAAILRAENDGGADEGQRQGKCAERERRSRHGWLSITSTRSRTGSSAFGCRRARPPARVRHRRARQSSSYARSRTPDRHG